MRRRCEVTACRFWHLRTKAAVGRPRDLGHILLGPQNLTVLIHQMGTGRILAWVSEHVGKQLNAVPGTLLASNNVVKAMTTNFLPFQ